MLSLTWAFSPPMEMKLPSTCHSDPAVAGEESASSVLHRKRRSLSRMRDRDDMVRTFFRSLLGKYGTRGKFIVAHR